VSSPVASAIKPIKDDNMTPVDLSELILFDKVCADPYAVARNAAASGKKIAGYMCSYSPQELLHAAGYLPVRVMGRLGATPKANELMQAFICSFAKSSFDAGLSGELDFLQVIMFAHTCDTMQNLADLWQGRCPQMKTIITALPNVHTGAAAHAYFRQELDRVRCCIEELAGPISDETLMESIRLYERHREKMKALYALRYEHPNVMTGTEMITVVLSSFLMPREEHLELIASLYEKLKLIQNESNTSKPKVVVGGSVCQAKYLIQVIEESGCLVADDDLCMGTRSYLLPAIDGNDPMDILVRGYLGRTPCPAVHKDGFDPASAMIEHVRQVKADGVVFLITKFCDPFGFDYPHVNSKIEEAGIPSLMLEVEQHQTVSEQVRTRMEAFVEMMNDRKSRGV